MPLTYRTDVLVIGAGPASLAAGVGCRAGVISWWSKWARGWAKGTTEISRL
jgi:hypothetical protein